MSRAPSAQLMPTLNGLRVRDRHPERVDRLARQRAAAAIGDRDRDHQRQPDAAFSSNTSSIATMRGLGVERVEDRFEQQQIAAAVDQAAHLFLVGVAQLVERDARGTPDC